MSAWDDILETHPVIELFQELAALLGGLEPDSASIEPAERLKKVVSLVQSTIDQVDAELVTQSMIDGVYGPASSMAAEIRAFTSDGVATRLQTANQYADQILDVVTRWPVPRTARDLDGLRERASSFRASVGQLIRRLESDVHQVEAEIENLRATLQTTHGDATNTVESIRQDGAARIEEASVRVAELATTVESQKARLDQAIAVFQQQFSEAEATRAQRFESAAKHQQDELTTLMQTLTTRGEEGLDTFVEAAEKALADLREKEREARTLAAALGAIGVSGGHGAYAKEEKKAANLWRGISVVSILGLVVGALLAFITLPDGGIEWERYVGKFLISAPLIALAGYAASQSARHRRAEREARKLDLDLAALELYLALFSPEKRNEIKEAIALKVFGQPLSADGAIDDRVGAGQLWDFITKYFQPK